MGFFCASGILASSNEDGLHSIPLKLISKMPFYAEKIATNEIFCCLDRSQKYRRAANEKLASLGFVRVDVGKVDLKHKVWSDQRTAPIVTYIQRTAVPFGLVDTDS